ncbi:hypothetical protein BKI52_13970 [marine bacterium AO1-C]|nr:hypothetical protein BKI52_13970 [marine bacterium AO1-C]
MFTSYLKTAFRNLWRNKLHSAINLLGLTLGISCCFILWLYIQDEWQFDMSFPNSKRIYRITEEVSIPDQPSRLVARTSSALALSASNQFPEIEQATIFIEGGHSVITLGDKSFNDRRFQIASPNVFKTLGISLIKGNANTALNKPNSVVLTETSAKRLFGHTDVIGKTFKTSRLEKPVTVTGVMPDFPENTHLSFSMFLPIPQNHAGWKRYLSRWDIRNSHLYLLLKKGSSPEEVTKKLQAHATQKAGKDWQNRKITLEALSDIHFYTTNTEAGINDSTKGNIFYLYAFIIVALFLLIIASINYVNLTTAKSVYRAREIGVRKVMGAYRKQLVFQFLLESSLIASLAFIISIGVTDATLPYFNELAGKNFDIDWGNAFPKLIQMFFITLMVGLLAGIYPALVLSGYKPVYVLKSQVKTSFKGLLLRRSLVISQFTLSVLMIIATLTVRKQLHYVQNKKMGFDKEQMMVMDINSGKIRKSFKVVKNELLKHPAIKNVTATSRVPGDWKDITQLPVVAQGKLAKEAQEALFMGIDKDFINAFKVKILEGQNFLGKDQSDSTKVLINQLAAQKLGVKVGDYIRSADTSKKFKAKVFGIVNNFHTQSLHNKLTPVVMGNWNNPIISLDYITAKVSTQNPQELIAYAQKVNDQFDADTPLELHFLNDQMKLFYKKEILSAKIFNIAAFITILIASMGLFGLATFTIQKRTKEIAIRKVLGASQIQLFALLSKGYIKQIVFSFLLAFPLGYYIMNYWLKDFAYRTSIGVMVFVWAALAALMVTFITIGYQTFIAARHNPVDSLRNE